MQLSEVGLWLIDTLFIYIHSGLCCCLFFVIFNSRSRFFCYLNIIKFIKGIKLTLLNVLHLISPVFFHFLGYSFLCTILNQFLNLFISIFLPFTAPTDQLNSDQLSVSQWVGATSSIIFTDPSVQPSGCQSVRPSACKTLNLELEP